MLDPKFVDDYLFVVGKGGPASLIAPGREFWLAQRRQVPRPERRRSAASANFRDVAMQHQISVITLGVADLSRSRRFYRDGFGWTPVFENEEIVFYQMNGFVLGTWLTRALEADMQRTVSSGPGALALAHNVSTREEVQATLDRLSGFGGRVLRAADEPPHGGFRGYIADPDDHAWEIAWNPAWPISPEGFVRFGV